MRPTISTDGATESVVERAAAKARPESEDGEIEDAKMADVITKVDKGTVDGDQVTDERDVPTSQPAPPTQAPETNLPVEATPRSQTPNLTSSEPSRVPTPGAVVQTKSQLQDLKSSSSAVAGSSSPIPPRPEAARSSSGSAVNGRVQHGLPNRPEPPHSRAGEHRMSDRERAPRDHVRDSRHPERGTMDGPRDAVYERAPERHVLSSQQRSYERVDRPHNAERERGQAGWGGERGLSGRPNPEEWHSSSSQSREPRQPQRGDRTERLQRDRPAAETTPNARAFEPQGQPSHDGTMAPPRSTISQHPDRAALIHGNTNRDRPPFDAQHLERRQEARRYDGHLTSDRSSRPGSPSRLDDRRNSRLEPRRDDRPPVDLRHTPDTTANGRLPRYEDNRLPTGPRTDRSMPGSEGSPHDRFRDSPRNASTTSPATDLYRRDQGANHNSRQQESQYGRLNAGPEIPLGPRLPNGNTAPPPRAIGRNVSAPHHVNTQQTQPYPASQNGSTAAQEKQTPTGPSSQGPPRNAPPMPRPDSAQSALPTPATDTPDTAGVHPDRLRAIQGAGGASSVSAAQGLSSMGRPLRQPLPPVSVPPTPGQRPIPQMPSPGGPLPSPGAPMSGPVGPSPTSRGPPTGPSCGNDRSRGEKRMFAGLQSMLQQAGTPNTPERSGQGASIRGRGGRTNNSTLPSPSASDPPTAPAPRPEAFPGRGDLFANRPPTHSVQQSVEDDSEYGRGTRRGGAREPLREYAREPARDGARGRPAARDEGRNEERRSGYHRSSRDHSRDTGPAPPIPPRDDERPPRRDEPRDRGRPPMPPPMEREMRRPPRMDEQRRAESDRRDVDSWNTERRAGMERRDDRDRRDGGGSGRKRARGGDEGYNDSKRPRRSG